MPFPDDWQGYAETVALANPSSALTDFVYLISLNSMPANWWNAVKADGGDIRASKADNTQLPCDVIEFDSVNKTGLIAVLFSGSKSAAVSESIRIWAGNAAATLPAVTDTYGQYNTYPSSLYAFWPNGGGNDRTSKLNHLTLTGGGAAGASDGPINGSKATDYNGSTQYGEATANIFDNGNMTLLTSSYADSGGGIILGITQNNTTYDHSLRWGYDMVTHYGAAVRTASTTVPSSTGQWQRPFGRGYNGDDDRDVGFNGGNIATNNQSASSASGMVRFCVGAFVRNSTTNYFDGRISLAQVWRSVLSNVWLAYEYNMLSAADSSQAGFYGGWIWQDTGEPPLPTEYALDAETANIPFSGHATVFLADRMINLSAVNLPFTANAGQLLKTSKLDVESVALPFIGYSAAFNRSRNLDVQAAALPIIGYDATLSVDRYVNIGAASVPFVPRYANLLVQSAAEASQTGNYPYVNPYTLVYDTLIGLLRRSKALETLLGQSWLDKIITFNTKQGHFAWKDELRESNLPEIVLISRGIGGNLNIASNAAQVVRSYDIVATTSQGAIGDKLYAIEWAISCALADANFDYTLRQLQWAGQKFIRAVAFNSGDSGEPDEASSRGLSAAWVSIWSMQVTMVFAQSQMLQFNRGVELTEPVLL